MLGGCAGPAKRAAAPPQQQQATLLLPVTFINLVRPGHAPALLDIVVETASGHALQFTQRGVPVSAEPAAPSDYLFRMLLPPGRYRITRLAGASAQVRFGVDIGLAFEVEAPTIRYMGRLIVQNVAPYRAGASEPGPPAPPQGLDGGVLAFNTAWRGDDDIARYRAAVPALQAQKVEALPFDALSAPGRSGAGEAPRSFDELNVARVGTMLAAPPIDDAGPPGGAALRKAWRGYLAAPWPKAFAVSADGRAWGAASGAADAATRALVECARKGQRCALFALNDRRVVERLR